MDRAEKDAARWAQLSSGICYSINGCCYLHVLARGMAAVNGLFAVTAIVFRHYALEFDLFWYLYSLVSTLCVLICVFPARLQFVQRRDVLLRLDHYLDLNNRVVVAAEQALPWPAAPRTWPWPYQVHPWRLSAPLLLSGLVLGLALLIPVPGQLVPAAKIVGQPSDWEQIAATLNELEESTFFEPEQIQDFEDKLATLQAMRQDEWFSSDSLEATENLQNQLQQNLGSTARNAALAANHLDAMQQSLDSGDLSSAEQAQQAFENARQRLAEQGMQLNASMRRELEKMSISASPQFRNLSAEQLAEMQQLSQSLSQCSNVCTKLGEQGKEPADEKGKGYGLGRKFKANGPIQRGPGVAPMAIADEGSQVETSREGVLDPLDVGPAALGDLIGESRLPGKQEGAEYQGREHGEVFRDYGRGGATIWKQNITPAEREALSKFYQ